MGVDWLFLGARRSSHFPLRVRCFSAMSHTNRLDLIAAIHNHNLRGYGLLLAMETVLRQIDFVVHEARVNSEVVSAGINRLVLGVC